MQELLKHLIESCLLWISKKKINVFIFLYSSIVLSNVEDLYKYTKNFMINKSYNSVYKTLFRYLKKSFMQKGIVLI